MASSRNIQLTSIPQPVSNRFSQSSDMPSTGTSRTSAQGLDLSITPIAIGGSQVSQASEEESGASATPMISQESVLPPGTLSEPCFGPSCGLIQGLKMLGGFLLYGTPPTPSPTVSANMQTTHANVFLMTLHVGSSSMWVKFHPHVVPRIYFSQIRFAFVKFFLMRQNDIWAGGEVGGGRTFSRGAAIAPSLPPNYGPVLSEFLSINKYHIIARNSLICLMFIIVVVVFQLLQ